MKRKQTSLIDVTSLAICLGMLTFGASSMFAGPIAPAYNPATGNVTWGYPQTGLDPKINPITTDLPPDGSITFYWTDGDDLDPISGTRIHLTHAAPGYAALNLTDDTDKGGKVTFNAPVGSQPPITDYHLEVTGAGFKHGSVTVGSLQNDGSWAFVPLNTLLPSGYRIPEIGGVTPIYTAVDLATYMNRNPLGPLDGNYVAGDTLDSLGLNVVDGMIPGLSGIYFATSPFGFDPNSDTGFVPINGSAALLNLSAYESFNGSVDFFGAINSTPAPEPGSLSLIAIGGLLIVAGCRRRCAT